MYQPGSLTPGFRLPAKDIVDPGTAINGGGHRNVRSAALGADDLAYTDLVQRAGEDGRHAAAAGAEAVVPHHVGGEPVTGIVPG